MCASFNDLENCGGNGAIPVDHHDTLDDDEIPNLLDYLEEFDAESDPNNDNSCFSVLQSLLNDEPLSIPSSPTLFNFGINPSESTPVPLDNSVPIASHSEDYSPPEAKKLCNPDHATGSRQIQVMSHNASKLHMKPRDGSNCAELSKLLDSSRTLHGHRVGSEKPIPDISHFSASSLREHSSHTSSFSSPQTPDFGTSPGSGGSYTSDESGFRSGSSLSDHNTSASNRACSEPSIVKLKLPEETSRFCFEALQRCAQTVITFVPYKTLSRTDRGLLISQSWVALFLIAITEENIDIKLELKNFCNRPNAMPCWKQTMCANKLAKIFAEKNNLPTVDSANCVKSLLNKIASLKLSDEEYFYMKIISIFNPELVLLKNAQAVFHSRTMAEQALRDHARIAQHHQQQQQQQQLYQTSHQNPNNPDQRQPNNPGTSSIAHYDPLRVAHCLSLVTHLKEVPHQIVTELFFRPVLGFGLDMGDVVMEMFNSKDEQLL